MKITINGEPRDAPEGATVGSLLAQMGIPAGRVACELNGEILRRSAFSATPLKDGDVLEIIHAIGGGSGG